jgi:hypothetical protein
MSQLTAKLEEAAHSSWHNRFVASARGCGIIASAFTVDSVANDVSPTIVVSMIRKTPHVVTLPHESFESY